MLVLSGYLFWQDGWLSIQVAFASEQTHIFEAMRVQARQGNPASAVGCLGYVVRYYPFGTKQTTGSRLDLIMERERAFAVRDIIAYLKAETGEDLGDQPEAWIQKYAPE